MIIYFDADDTLWYTNVIYERAYDEFVEWALERFDTTAEEITELVRKVDLERARRDGFHRTGFSSSMVATYQELCKRYGVTPTVEDALKAYHIGDSVYDDLPQVDDSAVDVLQEVGRNYRVNVLTMGDQLVQSAKIYLTGIYQYVEDARIVPHKETAVYRELFRINPEAPHVMVGNSKKSDIVPALDAGWYAVWLQHASTWEWDDVHLEPHHPRLHIVKTLRQVPEAIRLIEARVQEEHRAG